MRRQIKAQLDKTIGHNITATRNAHDLTKDELAELTELKPAYLGQIERGKRGATAVTLASLSKVLNTPVDHFFTNPQTNENPNNNDDKAEIMRKKIMSLSTRLTESELSYVTYIIQGMPRENIDKEEL